MPAGLLLGIAHDRRLLREAQVNIAIRWFIGYGLEDRLPDHSSLTRSRRRWGGMKASITLEDYKDWGSYAAWRALKIEGCLLPRRAPATGKLNARRAASPGRRSRPSRETCSHSRNTSSAAPFPSCATRKAPISYWGKNRFSAGGGVARPIGYRQKPAGMRDSLNISVSGLITFFYVRIQY